MKFSVETGQSCNIDVATSDKSGTILMLKKMYWKDH